MAYNLVNQHVAESYRNNIDVNPLQAEGMFNAARFLANTLGNRKPPGINNVYVYYTLSKLAFQFGGYKTARFGYDKLGSLKIPDMWQEEIEVDSLKVKCKPNSDKEGIQMNTNPLAFLLGQDSSNGIGVPTIYNQASFDSLPLVEFRPTRNLLPKRVTELLRTDPPNAMQKSKSRAKKPVNSSIDQWGEGGDNEQVMSFADNDMQNSDMFTLKMMENLDHST